MKTRQLLAALAIAMWGAAFGQGVSETFQWQNHFDRLYSESAMRYHFADLLAVKDKGGDSLSRRLRQTKKGGDSVSRGLRQTKKGGDSVSRGLRQTQKLFSAWQKSFRAELKDLMGLTVLERKLHDFRPEGRLVEREELDFCTRERWIIWTEPDVPLPCVILRPRNLTGKVPLVITPHGHSLNTELYAGVYRSAADTALVRDGERDIAVQAVREGYIAIAPTARGFGPTRHERELSANATSSCRTLLLNDMLVGRTPIGDRVWDIMKIIDYALENLPVDGRNVIVTGQSGGGTATIFAGAVEPRITISAPACAFCTMSGSIGSIIHCECNYLPGIMELGEMSDVAGLTAPRCFYPICGKKDEIFPIGEARRAFAEVEQVYRCAGAEGNCQMYEGEGGHRYYKAGVWQFVREHLK